VFDLPAFDRPARPPFDQVKIDMPVLLDYLARLLEEKGHAVVAVAEGAGQDLLYERERGPGGLGGVGRGRGGGVAVGGGARTRGGRRAATSRASRSTHTRAASPAARARAAGEPRPADESGNPVLRDIGAYLKAAFKGGALGEVDCKYIEPRSLIEVGACARSTAGPLDRANGTVKRVLTDSWKARRGALAGF
jgi:hypothetical protein